MGVQGVLLVCALCLPVAGAADALPSPEYKFQSFYPGWEKLHAGDSHRRTADAKHHEDNKHKDTAHWGKYKGHNKDVYANIAEMAETGENGIKTLKGHVKGHRNEETILYYTVHESGTGKHHPYKTAKCDIHYKAMTIDGAEFDNSWDRGEPGEFTPEAGGRYHTKGEQPNLERLIGWTEALQQMVEGDMWELYIPSEFAYGDRGNGAHHEAIPGGATLVYIVKLEKIKGAKMPRAEL